MKYALAFSVFTTLLLAPLAALGAAESAAQLHPFQSVLYPQVTTSAPNLDRAFRIARGDIDTNIIPAKVAEVRAASDNSAIEENLRRVVGNKSFLIPSRPSVLTAGLDYGVFTGDNALSTWGGMNLLYPEVARTTLLATLKVNNGELLIGGRYWDTVIWTSGAWQFYLATGDRDFLEIAVKATENALHFSERNEFDPQWGLFRGPAFWADGISAYPDAWAAGAGGTAHIMSWPKYNPEKKVRPGVGIPMYALSTNCVFFHAYELLGQMRRELGWPEVPEWEQKAAALKQAINHHFWREDAGCYRYLVDSKGGSNHQEGFGHAFAILFGVADRAQIDRILATQHITPQGIPCIWPNFPRYETPDGQTFGNHAGTIWPPISGLWAEACSRHGHLEAFGLELRRLADRACRDNQFSEIYHPVSGEIYGGVQEGMTGRKGELMKAFLDARLGDHGETLDSATAKLFPTQPTRGAGIRLWQSCARQTWSATAYLRMVLRGLLGIELDTTGMTFAPCVPDGVGPVAFYDLRYRNAVVEIHVTGSGHEVKSLKINGQSGIKLPISATGSQLVEIELR